jgi:hypothetical protein
MELYLLLNHLDFIFNFNGNSQFSLPKTSFSGLRQNKYGSAMSMECPLQRSHSGKPIHTQANHAWLIIFLNFLLKTDSVSCKVYRPPATDL